jgi:NAD(P)-dependent dehydrogenase (short-subunit alcohol dehydrogenase family)
MQKTILITGCSSGIGAALARALAGRGQRVYATARRPEALAALEAEGIRGLALDVNDDASIARAFETVGREVGRLDMLINNAGFSQVGAVVDLGREDLRRQFETNVVAPVAVTRAALPLLRAAVARNGSAVLANVGSIVGFFTTPLAGAYCASKAALHALTDALRMELAPFGIRVVCIQPGGVRSAFGDHAEAALRLPENSVYRAVESGVRARAQAGQRGATPAEDFVGPVADALLRRRPPRVIRGGKNSLRLPLLQRFLPQAAFDAMLVKAFGLDRLKP